MAKFFSFRNFFEIASKIFKVYVQGVAEEFF
jgi:hypothetical protein